jgi:tetratricopeptide (TPR) repeat protein
MKPKIFIGSSVEGLSVAYAIQQNLTHDAESTVWDQGVFNLSQTTIESLTKEVDENDFGVFVFSPDDMIKMRGKELHSIRDNVIFEFGLFIGRLGRNRVFFIVPDGSDLHLPTDLLGITPGRYNPNREDGRLQAATGSACNQIREAMKKIPLLRQRLPKDESDESSKSVGSASSEWITDLLNNEFSEARQKLALEMQNKTGEDLQKDEAWMVYIEFKENEVIGLQKIIEFANKNLESLEVVALISKMLSWENYYDRALEIVNLGLEKFPNDSKLLILKASHIEGMGDKESAISLLRDSKLTMTPEVAVALCEKYAEDDMEKAIEVIHAAYTTYPNNKEIAYKYARLLLDEDRNKEALYLLNYLSIDSPKEVSYWGYLSNACLKLNFYDKAMTSLKKALELSKESEAWLLHNVGNLLNNKGFYTDAEDWLNRGLKLEPSSQYAHERLATVIKKRSDENSIFYQSCKEGKTLIWSKKMATDQ